MKVKLHEIIFNLHFAERVVRELVALHARNALFYYVPLMTGHAYATSARIAKHMGLSARTVRR